MYVCMYVCMIWGVLVYMCVCTGIMVVWTCAKDEPANSCSVCVCVCVCAYVRLCENDGSVGMRNWQLVVFVAASHADALR